MLHLRRQPPSDISSTTDTHRPPRYRCNSKIQCELKKGEIRRGKEEEREEENEKKEEEEENSPLLLCGLLSCQTGLCAIDSHSVVFSDAKRRRGVVEGVGWVGGGGGGRGEGWG